MDYFRINCIKAIVQLGQNRNLNPLHQNGCFIEHHPSTKWYKESQKKSSPSPPSSDLNAPYMRMLWSGNSAKRYQQLVSILRCCFLAVFAAETDTASILLHYKLHSAICYPQAVWKIHFGFFSSHSQVTIKCILDVSWPACPHPLYSMFKS